MFMLWNRVNILHHYISTDRIVWAPWMKTDSFLHQIATIFETGDLKI